MIIMQVSYASHNYGTVELIKHSNTKPLKCHHCGKKFRFFSERIMFYGFLRDSCRLPTGFRCRSGNSPNYLQLAGSYQVEKSE